MSEKQTIFAKGIYWKDPSPKSPDFIKGKLSFFVEDFVSFLESYKTKGWVNIVLKESKSGNLYLELDTWQPTNQKEKPDSIVEELNEGKVNPFEQDEIKVEDIPF